MAAATQERAQQGPHQVNGGPDWTMLAATRRNPPPLAQDQAGRFIGKQAMFLVVIASIATAP